MTRYWVAEPGPRLPYWRYIGFLWPTAGNLGDFDTDGDSRFPDDPHWTELTLESRRDPGERVDVESSPQPWLAARLAYALAASAGGRLLHAPSGPAIRLTALLPALGPLDGLPGALRQLVAGDS